MLRRSRLLTGIQCWEKERWKTGTLSWENGTHSELASILYPSLTEVVMVRGAPWLPGGLQGLLVLIWTYWLESSQAAMVFYAEVIAEQSRQYACHEVGIVLIKVINTEWRVSASLALTSKSIGKQCTVRSAQQRTNPREGGLEMPLSSKDLKKNVFES